MSETPNLNLPEMPENTFQPSVPFNGAMQILDALVQLTPEDDALTIPPTTLDTDAGKTWIVATGATGDWAGKDGQIALCTAAGLWTYIVPRVGWRAYILSHSTDYRYTGSAWTAI